tara:strand:+ start:6029 stop:6892 length:864 start_codon:yes stop_codon:yes gene_type:complete
MDKNKQQTISAGLYLVSTPIGNMEDITLRALQIIKKSDLVLCEDTRRSGKLFSYFGIKNKLFPYHKFNEKKVSDQIIDLIKKDKIVSLISDAGTPTISDPGLILVKKCIDENLNIFPIPGPSAVTSAVSVSGFVDKYLFYGFLPKKKNEIKSIFNNLSKLDFTIVFFIPISKINFYLSDFKKYFGDRKIVIAKEMTKMHEKFIRGDVSQVNNLVNNFSDQELKGEFTVVLSSKNKQKNIMNEINDSIKIEIKKMLKKYTHKDVVDFISKKEDLPKKIVYDFCLKLKK